MREVNLFSFITVLLSVFVFLSTLPLRVPPCALVARTAAAARLPPALALRSKASDPRATSCTSHRGTQLQSRAGAACTARGRAARAVHGRPRSSSQTHWQGTRSRVQRRNRQRAAQSTLWVHSGGFHLGRDSARSERTRGDAASAGSDRDAAASLHRCNQTAARR